jgi:hypothetical protein
MNVNTPIPQISKDPSAKLDYGWDWADDEDPWLADGETITAASITRTGDVVIENTSNTPTTVTTRISAGTVGTVARITCQITTSTGQVDQRSIDLVIVDR